MRLNLDPIANAKTIAYIMIIFGAYDLIDTCLKISPTGFSITSPFTLLSIVNNATIIVVGVGLSRTKLWGLYGLLIWTVFSFIYSILSLVTSWSMPIIPYVIIISNVINITVLAWLYSAKKRFKK